MSEFILEYEVERIKNTTTREYMYEVISSYNNGNYRATIVLLYSVVIFDLLHKLIRLRELYDSEEAKEILEDIDEMHNKDTFSDEWEKELIKRVTANIKKTNSNAGNEHNPKKKYIVLLDPFVYGKFYRLKMDRNNCAHPTCDDNYFLRGFNRDETRTHIRNMMEYIFLKDVIFGNDICDLLEADIQNMSSVFGIKDIFDINEKEKVKKYFSHKFFCKLNDTGKKQVLKYLWNKTMCSESNANLDLYYFVLLSLVEENIDFFKNYFSEDIYFKKDFYNEDNIDTYSEYLEPSPRFSNCGFARLICFYAEYSSFYNLLPLELKTKIKIISSKYINYYLLAYYLDNDMKEHLNNANTIFSDVSKNRKNKNSDLKYDDNVMLKLYEYSKNMNNQDTYLVKKFIIEYSLSTYSYDDCRNVLEDLILNIIKDFDREDFMKLFDGMNSNSQFYDMGKYSYYGKHPRFDYYYRKIKEYSNKVLGDDYDYSLYNNLN